MPAFSQEAEGGGGVATSQNWAVLWHSLTLPVNLFMQPRIAIIIQIEAKASGRILYKKNHLLVVEGGIPLLHKENQYIMRWYTSRLLDKIG